MEENIYIYDSNNLGFITYIYIILYIKFIIIWISRIGKNLSCDRNKKNGYLWRVEVDWNGSEGTFCGDETFCLKIFVTLLHKFIKNLIKLYS